VLIEAYIGRVRLFGRRPLQQARLDTATAGGGATAAGHCYCSHRIFAKVRSAVSVTIKPLEDRIVVRPLESEKTTASGLVIPDTAKEKPQEGEVLAVGPGRIDDNGNRVPLDVAVGDRVIFSKYGGTEVKYDDDEYLILSARDVLAVIA
jgi:chaperonin GroES